MDDTAVCLKGLLTRRLDSGYNMARMRHEILFAPEDDWFDYRLEHDPRFLARVASARESLKKGKGIRMEDLSD